MYIRVMTINDIAIQHNTAKGRYIKFPYILLSPLSDVPRSNRLLTMILEKYILY